jgi:hypothetical protein
MLPRVLRRIALLAVGIVASGVLVTAAVASGPSFRNGLYAPLEKWVTHHASASVDLSVIDHGRMIRAKGSGLSCDNNGNDPLGEYSGIEFTTTLPHNIPISASGHFAYSATVKVSSYSDQTPYPIVTKFAINGQLVHGTIKPLKTVAIRGTVSSNYCVASTPKQYKLVFDPGG